MWLADLDLMDKLAPSTRALYERNMRQLVMPAFEHYILREITVRKVDQFIKKLASTKSYSTAKQARTVLSLAFGLAVRYDALKENPVRDTARMHKPPSQTMALTLEQVEAIRAAVRELAARPGTAWPAAGRPAGADHRGHARDIGPDRRGAGDPQVRRRRHCVAGDGAHLRDDRVAGGQADPSAAPPEDAEVDPGRVGPELRGRGAPPAARRGRSEEPGAPALLHPQRHAADDEQHPAAAARRAWRSRASRASRRTRSAARWRRSSTGPAARISPPRLLGHTSSKITKEHYIQPDEKVDPVTAEILESLAPRRSEEQS